MPTFTEEHLLVAEAINKYGLVLMAQGYSEAQIEQMQKSAKTLPPASVVMALDMAMQLREMATAPADPPHEEQEAAEQPAAAEPTPIAPPQPAGPSTTTTKEGPPPEKRSRPNPIPASSTWTPAGTYPKDAGGKPTTDDLREFPDFDTAQKWEFDNTLPSLQKQALQGWAGTAEGSIAKDLGLGFSQLKILAQEPHAFWQPGTGNFVMDTAERIIQANTCGKYDIYDYDDENYNFTKDSVKPEMPLTVDHAEAAATTFYNSHMKDKEPTKGRKFHKAFAAWYNTHRGSLWKTQRSKWGLHTMTLWIWHTVFYDKIEQLRHSNKKAKGANKNKA